MLVCHVAELPGAVFCSFCGILLYNDIFVLDIFLQHLVKLSSSATPAHTLQQYATYFSYLLSG